jgi:hypothetical protein
VTERDVRIAVLCVSSTGRGTPLFQVIVRAAFPARLCRLCLGLLLLVQIRVRVCVLLFRANGFLFWFELWMLGFVPFIFFPTVFALYAALLGWTAF